MSVFGSFQVGSAKRFSSENKAAQSFDLNVSTAQLESPPAPEKYQGLKTGPDFSVEYEPNETPPIDGSYGLARALSPFMIQVEPPLAYAVQGDKSKKDFAGILQAGHGAAPAAFRAARNAINASLPGGSVMTAWKSVEAFVAGGVINKPAGSDGLETKTLRGDGAGRIGTPAIADLYTAVDITMQLRALVNTPPLILLINPMSLSMKYTKKQQYTERTRYGFVFQAWGEEQPLLSIEAKCGTFISGGRGVQWASRRDSAAWQNLTTAFHFYRHNGYIYDTVGKSNAHHFVGALSIHYDGWVYYGNMESFNYSFEETQQRGGVVFSMEFVVNAMVDTSKTATVVAPMRSPIPSPSDPRYGGFANQATQGGGDFDMVAGTDEPATGVITAPGISVGGFSLVPTVSKGTQAGPGVITAVSNRQGFVSVVPKAVPVQAATTKKLTPFRVGG